MDRFQAVARGSQWMQAVKTDPTKERDLARRGGFCFRLCGLASRPSPAETGQAIHSIPFPCLGIAPLPPSPSPPLSFPRPSGAGGREGRDRPPAGRGERPTPILALSHPSVLTLRRQAIRLVLNRSWVVAQFPTHSLCARGRGGRAGAANSVQPTVVRLAELQLFTALNGSSSQEEKEVENG